MPDVDVMFLNVLVVLSTVIKIHLFQIYDFVILRNGCRLVTGSADSELRVFDISYTEVTSWSLNSLYILRLTEIHKGRHYLKIVYKYCLLLEKMLMVLI